MDAPVIEPRSRHTTAAAVIALLLAAPFGWLAFDLAQLVWGGRSLDAESRAELAQFDLSAVELGNLFTFGFWMVAILVVYVVVVAVGILRLREWARHAAILTFLFFGLLMIPMAIYGATYDPPSRNAWLGLLVGAGDLSVVVLLLTPRASDDFEDAEWLRRYHERERSTDHLWREFDRTGRSV